MIRLALLPRLTIESFSFFLSFFLSLALSFILSFSLLLFLFLLLCCKKERKRKNRKRRKLFQTLIHLQILMFSSALWHSPLILCPSVIQTAFFCSRRTFGPTIAASSVGSSVCQFIGPSDHQAEGSITRLLINRAIRHQFVSLLQATIGTLWSPSGSV